MPYDHLWDRVRTAHPDHSARYAQRWRDLAASGQDLLGETRLVDAMAPRGARILDAGCGTGRVGGPLLERGMEVIGVDLDEHLVSVAREDFPRGTWIVGDLAETDLVAAGATDIDVAVAAGQVLTFLDPAARRPALERIARTLAPQGRFVAGFSAGRGYEFADFREDAEAAGMRTDVELSTWDLRPFTPDSTFLVAIACRA